MTSATVWSITDGRSVRREPNLIVKSAVLATSVRRQEWKIRENQGSGLKKLDLFLISRQYKKGKIV